MEMSNKVIEGIISLTERSLEKAPDSRLGFFRSEKERAYRRNVVDAMFTGLDHDSQDKAMRYMFALLSGQNGDYNNIDIGERAV